MQTMKAIVLPSPEASAPTLALVPVPSIGAEELLVRIKAVGVGIHDSYFLPRQLVFPFPIGIEASGVIEEVGAAATGYQVGDRIAFVSMMQPKGGVWAEFAAVRHDSMILTVPERMSFEQAAAIPVAGNTTLRAFHALPNIPAGGSVFIAGASGAIGTFAVQLARKRGWEIAASASPRNHDHLTELGATLAVDYQQPDWPDEVLRHYPGGVDGAIAIQPDTTASSMRVVKRGGTVVTVSVDQISPAHGVTVAGLAYDADVLGELRALIDDIVAGDIKLVIEQVYSFEDALTALAKVQTRRARGKVVLSLP